MNGAGFDVEERLKQRLPERVRRSVDLWDRRIAGFLSTYGIIFLRIALAGVFIWFGAKGHRP